jgi:hypothetical protein
MSFYEDHCKTAADVQEAAARVHLFRKSMQPPRLRNVPAPAPPRSSPPPPVAVKTVVPAPVMAAPVRVGPVLGSFPEIDSVPIASIIEAACQYLDITAEEILSHSRKRDITFARHICIYVALETTQLSMASIARQVNGGDHSSTIHARDKVKELLTKDGRTTAAVEKIMAAIRTAYPNAKPKPERTPFRSKSIEDCPNSGKQYSEEENAHITRRWAQDGAIATVIARELGRTLGSLTIQLKKIGLSRQSKPLTIVTCVNPQCGQEFQQRGAGHCFCSNACRHQVRILRKKGVMA